MFQILPSVQLPFACPCCGAVVAAASWSLTGRHIVCETACATCGRRLVFELPTGHGLFYPGVLDAETGRRCDGLPFDNWYLQGLERGYRRRSARPVAVTAERLRAVKGGRVAVLSALDPTYGHALYKLFNAAWYLAQPGIELIIVVQRELRWLVPDGAAEVWTVDLPFADAGDWHDDLARQVRALLAPYPAVWLCRTFVQADSADFDIAAFSRVAPFPLEEWNARLARPTVTYVWRPDRFAARALPAVLDNRVTRRLLPALLDRLRRRAQLRRVVRFAEALRRAIPALDFAVTGLDTPTPALPAWIADLRHPVHTDEHARRQCRRYAESHLALGVNGSALLLPAAHAGALLVLTPRGNWTTAAGTLLFRRTGPGDTHFRYALVPHDASVATLVSITVSVLRDRALVQLQTEAPWRDHSAPLDALDWARFRQAAFEAGRAMTETGAVTRRRVDR